MFANLASECSNVTVCENPIGKNNEDVIFGPRFGRLNESTSSILTLHDYQLRAEIFKNLEDIKKGDEIILWYQSKKYKYKVTEIKTVAPSDVSVLKPTSTEQVTLMTCVPVGTNQKRLVVIGKPL